MARGSFVCLGNIPKNPGKKMDAGKKFRLKFRDEYPNRDPIFEWHDLGLRSPSGIPVFQSHDW